MDYKPYEVLDTLIYLQDKFGLIGYPIPTGIQVSSGAFLEILRGEFAHLLDDARAVSQMITGKFILEVLGVRVTCDPNLERGEYRLEYKLKDEK